MTTIYDILHQPNSPLIHLERDDAVDSTYEEWYDKGRCFFSHSLNRIDIKYERVGYACGCGWMGMGMWGRVAMSVNECVYLSCAR